MILISLLLAATPTPVLKPDVGRRQAVRPAIARRAARSKRLIELQAAVRSLPLAAADPDPNRDSGPRGM